MESRSGPIYRQEVACEVGRNSRQALDLVAIHRSSSSAGRNRTVIGSGGERDYGGGCPGSRGERLGQHVPNDRFSDEHSEHHLERSVTAALAERTSARVVRPAGRHYPTDDVPGELFPIGRPDSASRNRCLRSRQIILFSLEDPRASACARESWSVLTIDIMTSKSRVKAEKHSFTLSQLR